MLKLNPGLHGKLLLFDSHQSRKIRCGASFCLSHLNLDEDGARSAFECLGALPFALFISFPIYTCLCFPNIMLA